MKPVKLFLVISIGIGLFILLYRVLNEINSNTTTVTISIKCLKNTFISLEYSSKEDNKTKKAVRFVNSAQVALPVTFELINFDNSKFLRLNLGDSVNIIFIESFLCSISVFSKTKYIYYWEPTQSVNALITEEDRHKIIDRADNYIQLEAIDGNNIININNKSFIAAAEHIYSLAYLKLKIGFAAAVLTTLFLLIFSHLPASGQLGINVQLRKVDPLVLFFGAVLIIFTTNTLFKLIPDIENNENRVLSTLPRYSAKSTYQYPDLVSKYFDEHFSFRNFLFFIHSYIQYKTFNEVVLKDKVIPGKQKFFYIDENRSLESHRRLSAIDTNLNQKILTNLISQQGWLAKRNCKMYILFAPDKYRIYPENMYSKFSIQVGKGYNYFDYYKSLITLDGRLTLIDPSDTLLMARKRKQVYFSGDTHWNYYGAFKAYQCILEEINKSFPYLEAIKEDQLTYTESFSHNGDLTRQLGLNAYFPQKNILFKLKDTSQTLNYTILTDTYSEYRKNTTLNKKQLKVMVFGDSFSYFLIPFLNKHFDESIYIRHYSIIPSLIEREKPDIVILESVERYLSNFLLKPVSHQIK